MDKTALKNLAEKAIPLLRKMFGDGVDFECTEYFKTNEAASAQRRSAPHWF